MATTNPETIVGAAPELYPITITTSPEVQSTGTKETTTTAPKKTTTKKQTTKKPATTTTTTKPTSTPAPEVQKTSAPDTTTTKPGVVTEVSLVKVGNQEYEIPHALTSIVANQPPETIAGAAPEYGTTEPIPLPETIFGAVPEYGTTEPIPPPETIEGAAPEEYPSTVPLGTSETQEQPSIIDTIIDFIQELINPTTPTTPTTPPETQPGTSGIEETTVPPSVTESALSELFSPKRLLVLGIIGLVTGIWLVGS